MKDEITFHELIDAIKAQWDPWYLLEVLDLEWDDLVDALQDKIQENYDKILEALE